MITSEDFKILCPGCKKYTHSPFLLNSEWICGNCFFGNIKPWYYLNEPIKKHELICSLCRKRTIKRNMFINKGTCYDCRMKINNINNKKNYKRKTAQSNLGGKIANFTL